MGKYYVLLFFFLSSFISFSQQLSGEEKKLYDLIMTYRKEKKLPAIPLSRALTFVAQTHAKDLVDNHPDKDKCNLHSWSAKGKWKKCCYTDDHANAECMWSKPRELTSYQGNGFEISYWSSSDALADGALNSWKKSNGHNPVIVNSGIWKDAWKAIGIGIQGSYALVWFGNEVDK
jgi:uncharacterized protein YkwD